MNVLTIGASRSTVCGVRDHAQVLAAQFGREGIGATPCWWERDEEESLVRGLRGLRGWLDQVKQLARRGAADVVLWHYSVFTYAHHGIPVFSVWAVPELRDLQLPVVTLFHEMAYPFGRRGWRGASWAASQRAVLAPIMQLCAAVIVTTEDRAHWVTTRSWLPSKPISVAPVFSTVPCDAPGAGTVRSSEPSIGIFGYGRERHHIGPVIEALARIRQDGIPARLVLVGAPGPNTQDGEMWKDAARRGGCPEALRFTDVLPPEELTRAIEEVDVIMFCDPVGPTSRKTTLAAALSAGKAVVAIDGPETWQRLVSDRAVVLAPPDGAVIADRFKALLVDQTLRIAQGDRALAFTRTVLAPDVVATKVTSVLRNAASR